MPLKRLLPQGTMLLSEYYFNIYNKMSTNTSNVLEYLLKLQGTGSRGEIGQLHM